jgi:hypothetical protein
VFGNWNKSELLPGQFSGKRTDVTLLPIRDDFVLRTLSNIPGILGKLDYVSELRENDRYLHWGLTRIYGEEATQRALEEVHCELFLQMLRTPLPQLVKDLACSAAGKLVEPRDFLESLVRKSKSLLPPEVGGGSVVHFNSIVAALLLLHARP